MPNQVWSGARPTSADSPNTRLILLRHGETSNPNIFHGAESDVGLSQRGRRQAELIAPVLAKEQPAAVISSAMRRAVETATPIAQSCQVVLQIESRLHERRVGALSGTVAASCNAVWKDVLDHWRAGELAYATPGAESFDDIQRRLLPVWIELADRHRGDTVVIVAHGVLIRVLLISLFREFQPFGWDSIGITNVALNELVRRGDQWELVRQNAVLIEVSDHQIVNNSDS